MSPEAIWHAYGLTCPPRVGTLRDPTRATYGRAIARISAQLGLPMMPHQRYAVDVATEVDPDTSALAYRDVTGLLPRQSGKTTLILGVQTHRALAMPGEVRKHAPYQRGLQRMIYAAQTRNAALEKWRDDHLPILLASPLAKRFRVRLATGQEALIWDTGAIGGITPNTETAGHGKVLDLGIEDEFFSAVDARLEQAFSPAMITRWSPQHWRVSTEGTEKSLYLAAKVDTGRAAVASGVRSGVCYLEWSNADGDRDDPRTWLSCMPALCPTPAPCRCDPNGAWRHTVFIPAIRAELVKMAADPDDFDRAYLNRRKGSTRPPDPNLPTLKEWQALADPVAKPTGPVVFALEISYDRQWSAIVAVGLHPDGKRRAIEVIEHRPGPPDWVVGRCGRLRDKWQPLAWGLAVGGPAGSLVQPLADIGIKAPEDGEVKRGQLWIPNERELGAACGAMVDAVRTVVTDGDAEYRILSHRDDPRLNNAWRAATTRPMGDLWMLARRGSDDITTVVAATVGLAAYEARKHLLAKPPPVTMRTTPPPDGRELWRPARRLNL